jgi:signal transduction histidine kinase
MSIAKAHGGSIIYVSELGVGTTAKVRLPLLKEEGKSPRPGAT